MKRRKARFLSHLIMDYFASYPSSQKVLNISIDGHFQKMTFACEITQFIKQYLRIIYLKFMISFSQ